MNLIYGMNICTIHLAERVSPYLIVSFTHPFPVGLQPVSKLCVRPFTHWSFQSRSRYYTTGAFKVSIYTSSSTGDRSCSCPSFCGESTRTIARLERASIGRAGAPSWGRAGDGPGCIASRGRAGDGPGRRSLTTQMIRTTEVRYCWRAL